MANEHIALTSPCDADQHYYEVEESFTRHLDKSFRRRGFRFVSSGRRVEAVAFTTPYAEDDLPTLVERIGATNVFFGSDWPHGEGLADPCSFRDLLAGLPQDSADRIMGGNLTDLIGL